MESIQTEQDNMTTTQPTRWVEFPPKSGHYIIDQGHVHQCLMNKPSEHLRFTPSHIPLVTTQPISTVHYNTFGSSNSSVQPSHETVTFFI
jgi:hypothetical protein